jgi:hypothetical protein
LLVDIIAVMTGYLLAKAIVHEDYLVGGGWWLAISRPVFATVAIWPVGFATFGLYQPRRLFHSHLGELQRLLTASVVAALLCVLVIFVTRMAVARDFIPVLLGSCLANVVIGRVVTRLLALAVNEW